jgi:hypothetical protein
MTAMAKPCGNGSTKIGQAELVAPAGDGIATAIADDEETFQDTIEGTLEETLEGTVEDQTIVEVHHPSSTEIMMANATKALALALARTAPVEVSSSMAFSNAIDMDNLCRVRTEDTTYSTVYRPRGHEHKSSRVMKKWLHQRRSVPSSNSRGSLEVSEDNDDDDDETFRTWNTLGSDDETQQEEASLVPIFDMKAALQEGESVDDQSDDTREPPSEHLVLEGDEISIAAMPKRKSGWRKNPHDNKPGKKEETQLTIRHRKENVEIVVNDNHQPDQAEKELKCGKRVVRFWTPRFSKRLGHIIHKGRKTVASSDHSSDTSCFTTSDSQVKHLCEKNVSPARCYESTLNESSVISTQEHPSVASLPSDGSSVSTSRVSSESVISRDNESTCGSREETVYEPSISYNSEESKLLKSDRLVRDASGDNGFEVEMHGNDELSISELSIRDESLEAKCSVISEQRPQRVQSLFSRASRASTVSSTVSNGSKMAFTVSAHGEDEEVSVTEKSLDTWGSYVDDEVSRAAPLIFLRKISMKRPGSSPKSTKRVSSIGSKSRPFALNRDVSDMSVESRSRSEFGLEPICKIKEEREDEVKEELAETSLPDTAQTNDKETTTKAVAKDDSSTLPLKDHDKTTQLEIDSPRPNEENDVKAGTTEDFETLTADAAEKFNNDDKRSKDEIAKDSDHVSVDEITIEMDVDDESVDEVSLEIDVDESSDDDSFADVRQSTYVISTLMQEDDNRSLVEMPGFEVLEVPQEINGPVEV